MNDGFVSRFIKGVLSTGIGTFTTIILGFLNIVIAVRIVPKEQFGAFVLMQVIVSFFVMAGDMGLNTSTTKFIAGNDDDKKRGIVNTVLCFKVASAAVISVIILLSRELLYYIFKSDLLSGLVLYIPLLFVLESLNALFAVVLQGLHLYKKLAGAQVLLSLVNFLAIMAFVVGLGSGLQGLIYARVLALLFSIIYQNYSLPFRTAFRYDKEVLTEIFRFGFPLGLNSVLTFVFTKIDTLIIGAFLNPIGVASYGAASKGPDSGRQMFNSFRQVYFPSMSELYNQGRPRDAERVLNKSLRAVSFVTALLALVVFLFQDGIVRLLFSARYLESAPVLSLLMFSLSIGLIGNILGTTLVSAGHSKLPVVINIVDAVVNVAANLILVPMFGIMGAAYAAVLARTATNPVNVWFLKRKGVRVNVMEFIKPLAALLACSAVFILAGTQALLFKLLLIGLYLAACTFLSVITLKDLSGLARGLRYRPHPVNASRT